MEAPRAKITKIKLDELSALTKENVSSLAQRNEKLLVSRNLYFILYFFNLFYIFRYLSKLLIFRTRKISTPCLNNLEKLYYNLK